MITKRDSRAIPPDFLRALRRGGLDEYFARGAFVHRAGYLSWIAAANRPETRRRKIREAMARLLAQWREELATTGFPVRTLEAAVDSEREPRRGSLRRSA